jgi:hypothetical protein
VPVALGALVGAEREEREQGPAEREPDRREQQRLLGRQPEHREGGDEDGGGRREKPERDAPRRAAADRWCRVILLLVTETNYSSGHDFVVEFLGYRFAFSAFDFEQRVTAAAVKLGLLGGNELEEEETADLVELAADGRIDEPRSTLGLYLVRHWERLAIVEGESLVYWIRKLVFRGAWLDHRVKEGLLEVAWDDDAADFAYSDPRGGRALLELAPVPSWHALQFRRR